MIRFQCDRSRSAGSAAIELALAEYPVADPVRVQSLSASETCPRRTDPNAVEISGLGKHGLVRLTALGIAPRVVLVPNARGDAHAVKQF
ncbi:hypothetical protein LF1_24750 [Rubripirellula obstinata]|uniref:Uncharacterized protein n=1 Tax=Rubripirellula obstinata TaxID=406547 RepID=A0A5B1CFF4_9BACT|nr:hypothetical protein LF1_24750 [Rubripirellula obstinata]